VSVDAGGAGGRQGAVTAVAFDDSFLQDRDPRKWSAPAGAPKALTPTIFFLGKGDHALEVALATSRTRPRADDVRALWRARQGRRPSPLLLIVGHGDDGDGHVTVCGPVGESPPLVPDLEVSQVERLSAAALAEPSRHAAVRFLISMLPEVGSDLPGVRNSGLLATQELRHGVPTRPDWGAAKNKGKPLLTLRGRALVESLGFGVEQLSTTSSVLTVDRAKRAVAVFLDEGEAFEDSGERFGASPISHALALADREGLPWVVLTRARQIRLYAARTDTGVGRKGRAETFVEVDLALLPDDLAGYLPLLFGAEALAEQGTIEQILERSADFAAELGARLRDRVYFETVPSLATAMARHLHSDVDLTDEELSAAYEETLVVLFRLLFVAYAEDKDLLPYRTNSRYNDHSLKRLARRLSEWRQKDVAFDPHATDLWDDVRALWEAVDQGNTGWGVPAYNGGLFSDTPAISEAGAAIARLRLSDTEFGPPLTALLVDVGPEGVVGPVDFRSLSVREFGTIYEGLLESMLSVAPSDLAVDTRGNYVPAQGTAAGVVRAGEVYFHNRSGSRKATGSYFTKPFAVEHLLDNALEPALDDHIARLTALTAEGDEASASEAFFDFRCVDLAMGSGHFLVAAVDRIESRLSGFLALNPIPRVVGELEELRAAAFTALGDLADGVEIETMSLLRRQVARRCIYGVDLNGIAVELARLAIWIHTFVPGLPLSFLDHNLVEGNSLTGIGTLDEAVDVLDPASRGSGQLSVFHAAVLSFLGRAEKALRRLAITSEATTRDIATARAAHEEALAAVEPAHQLFDILTAARLGKTTIPVVVDEETISDHPGLAAARQAATQLGTLHFPVVFPEVFLRDRPGFDCILGNPPWEKLHVEEHAFWGLRFPGLRSMPVAALNREMARLRDERLDLVQEYESEVAAADSMRALLLKGPYPDLGASHPDLYKAFCWRFWQLVRSGGAVGVVLPRSALSAAGSASWRDVVLDGGTFSEVTLLVNNRGWVFDDVHPQWTVGLTSIRRGSADRMVQMRGPFASLSAYRAGMMEDPLEFAAEALRTWSTGAVFPLIPGRRAGDVFLKLRAAPRFDSAVGGWRPKPVQGDLNATQGKPYMTMTPPGTAELWPVYSGGSFNVWTPDNGPDSYYAWIDPDIALKVLQEKRVSSARRTGSVFAGFKREWIRDPETLPCLRPRIAFRDVARATDSRTVIAALIPGNIVVNHKAPYLLMVGGDERDEAFLLGVMSSIPFDWYARRFVETSVTFELLTAFPVPRPDRDNPLRVRVESLAARLAAIDDRYERWAEVIGVGVGTVNESDMLDVLAELDATVALLYGLSGTDLKVIFDTFHVGWNHGPRLSAVLAHHRELMAVGGKS
jgi:hypothetical protein